MVFTDYKTPSEALRALRLQSTIRQFVQPLPHTVPPVVRERLEAVRLLGYTHTEFAVAEGLIFPVLLEVWLGYADEIKVWSRLTFGTPDLKGNPDYVVTRIPNRGHMLFEPPYVVLVEAKKENFDEGWGQCLAAMVAARQLNGHPELTVWGIVTTGIVWQFGKLDGSVFTQDSQVFDIAELDRLCGALRYVFEQIKHYPLPTPTAAPSAA